eukprot:TRINITY_DN2689_c0_g1_i1.p1 TRINITY_DN2689_c0_g1~~TRINITY_DN2689_c0_g1_i1.p1  ORF type:complete len:444 (+),score=75.56 TRINITY_DN2689_c0_g1_i1:503-1834(+)
MNEDFNTIQLYELKPLESKERKLNVENEVEKDTSASVDYFRIVLIILMSITVFPITLYYIHNRISFLISLFFKDSNIAKTKKNLTIFIVTSTLFALFGMLMVSHRDNFFIKLITFWSYIYMAIYVITFLGILFLHVIELISGFFLKICTNYELFTLVKVKKYIYGVGIILMIVYLVMMLSIRLIFVPGIYPGSLQSLSYQDISLELEGFKISHMADLHFDGVFGHVGYAQGLADAVKRADSDLCCITGDMVDTSYDQILPYENQFISLGQAATNVLACTGNHEYMPSRTEIIQKVQFITGKGVIFLNNTINVIERGSSKIHVVGIDDTFAFSKFEQLFVDLNLKTLSEDSSNFIIVMVHKPHNGLLDLANKHGIHLVLCGHVHKGQFAPLNLVVGFMWQYSYGLYELENSKLYVTSGAGSWGPPLRSLTTMPEIPVFQLKRKA